MDNKGKAHNKMKSPKFGLVLDKWVIKCLFYNLTLRIKKILMDFLSILLNAWCAIKSWTVRGKLFGLYDCFKFNKRKPRYNDTVFPSKNLTSPKITGDLWKDISFWKFSIMENHFLENFSMIFEKNEYAQKSSVIFREVTIFLGKTISK